MGSHANESAPSAEAVDERTEAEGEHLGVHVESATHAALFELEGVSSDACDVCGASVAEGDDHGYAVTGRGEYLWFRHGERRVEEPLLCASCAMAVGVSALARWEIEEEEG